MHFYQFLGPASDACHHIGLEVADTDEDVGVDILNSLGQFIMKLSGQPMFDDETVGVVVLVLGIEMNAQVYLADSFRKRVGIGGRFVLVAGDDAEIIAKVLSQIFYLIQNNPLSTAFIGQ